MSARRACFFDLDRTLVRVNTAKQYTRWRVRRGEAGRRELALMSWWLLRYTLGVLDLEALAERAAAPMAGQSEEGFRALMDEWAQDFVLPHLTDTARRSVQRARDADELCVILTSSTPYAAQPVARVLGIEHVLASRLEVHEGLFTGRPVKPLCYGQGKVHAASTFAREHGVSLERSAFYTDSISDRPMLEAVGRPVVVNPDPRLRVLAWRKGWPVERW